MPFKLNFVLIWCDFKQIRFQNHFGVDLYTQSVELFMLIHQTHNSEKGVIQK